MSVNWKSFETRINDAITSRTSKDENDFARMIATEYHSAVINCAQDLILANRVISGHKSMLESSLKSAFSLAKIARSNADAERVLRTYINLGVVAYWVGAQLSVTNIPPGAVSIVSNVVTFPGVPPDVQIQNTSDMGVFARELATRLRIHLTTIKGMTTVTTVSGPPLLIPINGLI